TATPLTMLFRLRFFFKHTPPAELSPLSLHDALPILVRLPAGKDLPEGSPDRGLDLAPAQMRHALIHAQDAPFAIVHDDRVAYGVKGESPLALYIIDLLKEQDVLQSQPEQVADVLQILDFVRLESHLLRGTHSQNAERLLLPPQQDHGDLPDSGRRHTLPLPRIRLFADFDRRIVLF